MTNVQGRCHKQSKSHRWHIPAWSSRTVFCTMRTVSRGETGLSWNWSSTNNPAVRTSTLRSWRSIGPSQSLPSSSIARNSFTVLVGTTSTAIISPCEHDSVQWSHPINQSGQPWTSSSRAQGLLVNHQHHRAVISELLVSTTPDHKVVHIKKCWPYIAVVKSCFKINIFSSQAHEDK